MNLQRVQPSVLDMNMSELSSIMGGANLNDDIMVSVINHFNRDLLQIPLTPFKLNYLTFISITNGELNISINYKDYKITKDYLIGIHPDNVINKFNVSKDFYCYILMVSKSFFEEAVLARKQISASHLLNIKEDPGIYLGAKEASTIKESLDRLNYYLKIENHNFKKEIIQNSFYIFLLELGNIFVGKTKMKNESLPKNRKEELARHFMALLREYGKIEHSPSFYSGKMCISTQYLSLLLKDLTGKVAKQWINIYLLTEAKIMLRYPDITIQTVSNDLHFYDQASFSKFFKKNMGISPKKYQEEYC